MSNLLFIIGMQKSGTSLLNRMLMQQSVINNPFLPEGKFFWGDNPPFNPVDMPCGELYQKHGGNNGHFLNGNDFNPNHQKILLNRIQDADIDEPILMNKNPYNSVRVAWLKKIFPECKIVAMYRNPLANVYSLLKKYTIDDAHGIAPENGWWGIKPIQWQQFVSTNKTRQCSNQWNFVNQQLLENIENIDYLINYDDLCQFPNNSVSRCIELCSIVHSVTNLPICKNFNDEYKIGSRLVSKNKELRQNKNFDLTGLNETLEFPPLSKNQIHDIQNICNNTWQDLNSVIKQIKYC